MSEDLNKWTIRRGIAEEVVLGPTTPRSGIEVVSLADYEAMIKRMDEEIDELEERTRSAEDSADEYARMRQELTSAENKVKQLRLRTHEIQAEEMDKRRHLQSRVDRYQNAYEHARQWTIDRELKAEWASPPTSPFWQMTSGYMRDALMSLFYMRNAAVDDATRLEDENQKLRLTLKMERQRLEAENLHLRQEIKQLTQGEDENDDH